MNIYTKEKFKNLAINISLILVIIAFFLSIPTIIILFQEKQTAYYTKILKPNENADTITVYYDGKTPIEVDSKTYSTGIHGITFQDYVYYFKGDTAIIDGKKQYTIKFSNL